MEDHINVIEFFGYLFIFAAAMPMIAGFVFIHTRPNGSDFTEPDNARTIAEFGQTPWLGTIPYIPELDTPTPIPFSKLPAAAQSLTQEILEKILP